MYTSFSQKKKKLEIVHELIKGQIYFALNTKDNKLSKMQASLPMLKKQKCQIRNNLPFIVVYDYNSCLFVVA